MKLTRASIAVPVTLLLGLALGGAPAVADPPNEFAAKTVSTTHKSRTERAQQTLARVEAALGGGAGRQAGSVHSRSLTLDLRDLKVMKDALPAREQHRVDVLTARPVFDATRCATVICVHYKTSGANAPDLTDADADGTPDYVGLVRDTTEQINDDYVAAGYRRPKGDGTVGGGTDKVDIYIQNLGAGLYGYCTTEDDPPTGSDLSAAAYCVLDNDYAGFPRTPEENIDVTAAHEYFHAVQFAYDFWQEDRWILESTATWAEDEMFDSVNDNRQYLSFSPMSHPFIPLDYSNDEGFHYGVWIFWRYLTEKFPAKTGRLPNLVRKVWEKLDGAPGGPNNYSLQGLAKVLSSLHTSLPKELQNFYAANLHPSSVYEEGASYAATQPDKSFGVTAAHANPTGWKVKLYHLSAATWRYTPKQLNQPDWKLKVAFDAPPKARGGAFVVTVFKKSGGTTTTRVALNGEGNASKAFPFSSRSVKHVDITFVNTSTRFDCWQQSTPYSCLGGVPKDDLTAYIMDPKAFRS